MKYIVSNYPAVRVFSGENVYVYNGNIDSASIKAFVGQGVSSYNPLNRLEFDPSGISSVFFHQISFNSFNLDRLYQYLLQHKTIFLISLLIVAFFFGLFVGITISSSALEMKVRYRVQALKRQNRDFKVKHEKDQHNNKKDKKKQN